MDRRVLAWLGAGREGRWVALWVLVGSCCALVFRFACCWGPMVPAGSPPAPAMSMLGPASTHAPEMQFSSIIAGAFVNGRYCCPKLWSRVEIASCPLAVQCNKTRHRHRCLKSSLRQACCSSFAAFMRGVMLSCGLPLELVLKVCSQTVVLQSDCCCCCCWMFCPCLAIVRTGARATVGLGCSSQVAIRPCQCVSSSSSSMSA